MSNPRFNMTSIINCWVVARRGEAKHKVGWDNGHGLFMIYQIIADLPKGKYRLALMV